MFVLVMFFYFGKAEAAWFLIGELYSRPTTLPPVKARSTADVSAESWQIAGLQSFNARLPHFPDVMALTGL